MQKADDTVRTFSPTERLIFGVLGICFAISAGTLLVKVSDQFMIEIPKDGGVIKEAIVGLPRFINPLLAISDADRDLTALIYSGLLKYKPGIGLIPDLAESYEISPDGLRYTFTLRPNLNFHDGHKLTAEDVEFTILKAQESSLKSPKRASWDGVSVERDGERKITFILNQPYSPFFENATIGILPKHIWKNVDAEQFTFTTINTEPIGSGPYLIKNIVRNRDGLPEYYDLAPFKNYTLGKPHIKTLRLSFFVNDEKALNALLKQDVDNLGTISSYDAKNISDVSKIYKTPLPRIFGVFFNQSHAPVFANREVRQALELATDRKVIVKNVLNDFGTSIDGAVPPGFLGSISTSTNANDQSTTTADITAGSDRLALGQSILEKNGWKRNSSGIYEKKTKKETSALSFSIATSNTTELKEVARMIKEQWEALGAAVEVKVFESGDLSQNIIRPRKYDALLFGEIIGRDLDLFPFWHSSQRNDPGFNIALYTNSKVDKIVSEARKLREPSARLEQYQLFEAELDKDTPAVFLYTPDFIYAVSPKIKGLMLGTINTAAERFASVHEWYIKTRRVWQFSNQ